MATASASANGKAPSYELPWVEKYRPLKLDDVVGNAATIDRLKVIQEDGNCPHLLISVCVALRLARSPFCCMLVP